MPIYKRCPRCQNRIPAGTDCGCTSKRYKEERKYTKDNKELKFYTTDEWTRTREKAIYLYNGLDIYSYYILNVLESGKTVHHIDPIRDNWERRLDISNLIYLTDSNHQIIHEQMKKSPAVKREIMTLLYQLTDRYKREFYTNQGEGVGKNVF